MKLASTFREVSPEQWVFDGVFNIHSHLHCWPVSELMSGSKKPAASLLGSPVQPNGHCFE